MALGSPLLKESGVLRAWEAFNERRLEQLYSKVLRVKNGK